MKKPSPPPYSYFNRNLLIQFRRRCGLTQEALAKEINLVRGGYAGYETGAIVPSLHAFRQVSLSLDLNPIELCDLLRLNPLGLDYQTRVRFVRVCKQQGLTPMGALRELIKAFSNYVEKA